MFQKGGMTSTPIKRLNHKLSSPPFNARISSAVWLKSTGLEHRKGK